MKLGPKSPRTAASPKPARVQHLDQTHLGSFVEAWINVLIGFGINFTANMLILPQFGFTSLTLATNFIIGMIYTVISVVRSYVIRRWFNAMLHRAAERLAQRING